MLNCPQFASQSVYQHGQSVLSSYRSILDHLDTGSDISGFRIPDWLLAHREQILASLHPFDDVARYLLYHDCGKPFCRVEEDGKVHFPNHAEVSRQIYLAATGDELVSDLIGHDMVIHVASSVDLEGFLAKWTARDACTLLLAALSEIHSNAFATSGIESTNFKMKWKNLDRRGRQIMKFYFK
jgi:hypothetical protein